MRQDRECEWCGYPESDYRAVVIHHVWPRSVRPDLIDDPANHMPLCSQCHDRTEENMSFMKRLQAIRAKQYVHLRRDSREDEGYGEHDASSSG